MIIGITGGIGSGKSTIAHELARRGYTVYDCDREAKRIIAENEEVRQAIIELLGQEAFVNGQYNTAYVAQRVFAEPALRARLNAIVHPAVRRDIEAYPVPEGKGVLFVESAILHEAGLDAICNKIITVDAPEEIRIARTIARDYHGEATEDNINKVRARMRTQKVPLGDLRLMNDGQTSIATLVEKLTLWMCKN